MGLYAIWRGARGKVWRLRNGRVRACGGAKECRRRSDEITARKVDGRNPNFGCPVYSLTKKGKPTVRPVAFAPLAR